MPVPFSWIAGDQVFSFSLYEKGLRFQHLLPTGTPDDIRRGLSAAPQQIRTLADTASAGGYDSLTLETALHCTGEDTSEHHGGKFGAGMPGLRLAFKGMTEQPDGMVLRHHESVTGLSVHSAYKRVGPCVSRTTTVVNEGEKLAGIEYLSSAMLANFAAPADIERDLLIHICSNGWQAEGQWKHLKPSQLGFVQNGEFSVTAASVSNLGSWSSATYLPLAMVENSAARVTWFWEIEYSGSWHWEISQTSARALYAYIGGPDEQHSHSWKNLRPGQSYTSVPVVLGCVRGGFVEVAQRLAESRRARLRMNSGCPVIFNDAVTLNLDPSTDKELPLIDAAAALGCETYVIDAGWNANRDENWWGSVGVWIAPESRWPGGLQAVVTHIRNRGMRPGIWLEPEAVGIHTSLAQKPDSWFFMRHGARVIDHGRYFLDFRNPSVTQYLDSVIDHLFGDVGFEYLKLDYNINALEGTATDADSPGQGLHEHLAAMLAWWDRVLARYPKLIVENCASGGGRIDFALLSRFQLQSASDQGDYRLYPAIVTGLTAGLLPEQLGVWVQPGDKATPDEASFNVVSAMAGIVQLSGAILEWSEDARRQVSNGIRIYKDTVRESIPKLTQSYPLGTPDITDERSPVALALVGKSAGFLVVWRLRGGGTVHLPVQFPNAQILYPTDLGIALTHTPEEMLIHFPREYMACLVRLL